MTHASQGQRRALEQLREVERAAGDLLAIEVVREPTAPGEFLELNVTLSCADLERADGGLPLEERESILILIPANFPFDLPKAKVVHDRFATFPHVQWKRSLCLYQAPSTEWNPSDGMFGFLDRLHLWLRQGALGQLDPIGAPLHPPVAYLGDGPLRIVIPRVDTPLVADEPWFGTAHLRIASDVRADIVGWSPFFDPATPKNVAAAVLLPSVFPYEFPTSVGELIGALSERGVSRERLFLTLQWAVMHNEEDAPLIVVIGTAMRGIRGGEPRQHLTAWYVEPVCAWGLKKALDKHAEDEETRAYGEKIEELVLDWANVAPVAWCSVREDRPEIVIRRDRGAPLSWFEGRSIEIWGCGALGGHAAEYLTRAGVAKLTLRDNGVVTPGILVRQPFDDADIGRFKVCALRDRLRRIRPALEIEVSVRSILTDPLHGATWAGGSDLVLDTTASGAVLGLLERRWWSSDGRRAPVVSMAIGREASRGMVVLASPMHSGGLLDITRRMKLEACGRSDLTGFLDEFWPGGPHPFFQPEPGCSDATFVGSAADVSGLAALMLNRVAADLGAPAVGISATGHFIIQPHIENASGAPAASFSWGPDLLSVDIHAGYQVRIAPSAWDAARSWIVRSRDISGPDAETGGLLFGERDDAAGIIWVSELSGPPPDSEGSAERFVCGVEGTAEMNAEKRARSRGSIQYLGMWHTHPSSEPIPSSTDWDGMRRLVKTAGGGGRPLMLIIGCPHAIPMLGTYVFRAADFDLPRGSILIRPCVVQVMN